ncbi:VV20781 family protein [Halovulum sp. GXIMD14794]
MFFTKTGPESGPSRSTGTAISAAGLGLVFLLAGCDMVGVATMAMPEGLAGRTDAVPIAGIGGGNKGSYGAAEYSGTFRRSETRLTVMDTVDRRGGYTRYTLNGPALSGPLEADCAIRGAAITLDVGDFRARPVSYRCAFTVGGRPIPARFELQQAVSGPAGALSVEQRRGEIALDRVVLQIRSIHKAASGGLPAAAPLGYVFTQAGQPVGAVETNGRPVVHLPAGGDEALRRAVMAGALALALYRDPADSGLGEL